MKTFLPCLVMPCLQVRCLLVQCLLIVALASAALCQTSSSASKPTSRATIEGIVVKEPGSEPVKKALIELIAESQAETSAYTAVSAADGTFRIEGIAPGRYRMFAERTGFLEVGKHRARSEGRVLTLAAGQEVKDLEIRLQAAAVVRGRVSDEDGDPVANAQVSVMRQTFSSGRSRWEPAGSERTNDLGEYRVAGLAAGNYYVSVNPPPDFKSLIESTANGSSSATEAAIDKPVATSYQATYYPGTTDRSQATPIQLHAGDEFPANISLTPTPTLSIRGMVVNLPARASAVIMLQSRDFNMVLNGAEMHKDGSFVIHDVSPGTYTILAKIDTSASAPMMARQSLQVSSNIEGVKLAPQPGAWIHGQLRFESRRNSRLDPSQMFVSLRPVDGDDEALSALGEGFAGLVHVGHDGSVDWKNVPPGKYFAQLSGAAEQDWFLKSMAEGGRSLEDLEITVNGGAMVLDLVASDNGAVVEGVVTDQKGEAVSNAVVVAAPPARLRSRVDRYANTMSDQSGRFVLRGIPPGEYTVFAWESVDGDAYYNPEFLKDYEGQGTLLRVGEGERKTLTLQVIPEKVQE